MTTRRAAPLAMLVAPAHPSPVARAGTGCWWNGASCGSFAGGCSEGRTPAGGLMTWACAGVSALDPVSGAPQNWQNRMSPGLTPRQRPQMAVAFLAPPTGAAARGVDGLRLG